jgi:hypothetical protein
MRLPITRDVVITINQPSLHSDGTNKALSWMVDDPHTKLHSILDRLVRGDLDTSRPTELCEILTKQNSDKSVGSRYDKHNYSVIYHQLLEPMRTKPLRFLEVGLGTNNMDVASSMGPGGTPGASLRAWRDYLPNADVHGADIDQRILFTEERINTHHLDQTDPSGIHRMWDHIGGEPFDFIMDDGLHEFTANRTLLHNSFHRLAPGGIYAVEDIVVNQKNIDAFCGMIQHIMKPTLLLFLHHPRNSIDNCLMLVENN